MSAPIIVGLLVLAVAIAFLLPHGDEEETEEEPEEEKPNGD